MPNINQSAATKLIEIRPRIAEESDAPEGAPSEDDGDADDSAIDSPRSVFIQPTC